MENDLKVYWERNSDSDCSGETTASNDQSMQDWVSTPPRDCTPPSAEPVPASEVRAQRPPLYVATTPRREVHKMSNLTVTIIPQRTHYKPVEIPKSHVNFFLQYVQTFDEPPHWLPNAPDVHLWSPTSPTTPVPVFANDGWYDVDSPIPESLLFTAHASAEVARREAVVDRLMRFEERARRALRARPDDAEVRRRLRESRGRKAAHRRAVQGIVHGWHVRQDFKFLMATRSCLMTREPPSGYM